jgi:hypothetical protein
MPLGTVPAGAGTLAGEGLQIVSPAAQLMNDLPPRWRYIMLSTVARNP